jgi:glycosyltransferase involved in cell wall biosynthesis
MRVLYDHQVFSLQNAGGASRYFFELAKYLAVQPESQAEVWLGMNGTVYPFRDLDRHKVRVSGLPEWLPPGRPRYFINEAWSRAKALMNSKVDVYHPTTYLRTPTIRTRRAVATHHDCTHERFPEYFAGAKSIFWARRQMLPSVDAIICVSEACRQDLLRFYNVDPAKTRVIHHGVTLLPRSPQAAVLLKGHMRREYLLYVGMRAKFKNFHGLLQAFHDSRLHESYDLLVLGASPLSEQEKTLIASLSLGDCVICLPKVSDAMLAEAYAGARLFIYPSFNEGFGFPPLEAMSLDCPVLASQIPATVEVCGDAPLYFDPADQAAFSRELLRAAGDEGARRQAIERGREVASRYSWAKCGEETLGLYRACQ